MATIIIGSGVIEVLAVIALVLAIIYFLRRA